MNLERLTLHLNQLHQHVIDTMSPVIEILPPPPIKIIVRPLLVRACIPFDCSEISVSSRGRKKYLYNREEISNKEFSVAHETGHYLHSQNCRPFEGYSEKDDSWKGTMRGNRRTNYNELTAEFFACLYFDLEKRAHSLSTRNLKVDLEILELYFSTRPIDQRKKVCRWLTYHSYDQVKRSFKNGPLNSTFRRLVMDPWKV